MVSYQNDIPGIVSDFLDESGTYLDTLNDCLLRIENDADAGQRDPEMLNNMYRAAHSLKGLSGMLGFTKINQLTHRMENVIDGLRNGNVKVGEKVIETLFECFDVLTALIGEVSQPSADDVDVQPALDRISQIFNTDGDTPKTDRAKYLPLFMEETGEEMDRFADCLLRLEKKPDDSELLDEIFRMAHRIKGSSGSMGFDEMCALTHNIESVLDRLRTGKARLNEAMMAVFLRCSDALRESLQAIGAGKSKGPDIRELNVSLLRFLEPDRKNTDQRIAKGTREQFKISSAIFEHAREALECGLHVYLISVVTQDTSAMAGMRAMLVLNRLRSCGDILHVWPDEEKFVSDQFGGKFTALSSSAFSENDLRREIDVDDLRELLMESFDEAALASMREDERPKHDGPKISKTKIAVEPDERKNAEAVAASNTLRVDAERLDQVMNLAGELVINKARFLNLIQELIRLFDGRTRANNAIRQLKERMDLLRKAVRQDSPASPARFVEEHLQSLDEQTEALSGVLDRIYQKQSTATGLLQAVDQLNRICTDIQSSVMATRMVPIGPLFNRYKRVVRDLAKERDKSIQLVLIGENTELDKKVVDELSDPLTHMVRNSADHGIENRPQRLAAGKSENATLTLRAYHKGNSICVEIEDDGKGIDPEKVSAKALEKGVITQAEFETLNDAQKRELIFRPGFSTAETVTDVSGRGMGMDIVLRRVEALKGKITMHSEIGKGTRFVIQLPLTLAIIQTLMSRVGKTIYAIPMESVNEIIQVRPQDIKTVGGQRVLQIRGKVIRLGMLRDVFGTAAGSVDNPQTGALLVVVVQYFNESLGLVVDSLIGEEEIMIKSLAENFRSVRGIAGASIMGDGKVSLILDVSALMELHKAV